MENDAESSTNPISQECGSNNHISVQISPTTGGNFVLTVDPGISIESLKKMVSKTLKIPRDRICLLFREKKLQEGNLHCNGVTDGSKITLLPNVETGMIAQKPEIGIMQALESVNDTQVNDFLCGKAPLNLTLLLGNHIMWIQLSLVQISRQSQRPRSSHCLRRPTSLTQASRNLQHYLRRLAVWASSQTDSRRRNIYSGIFSGYLNPAHQDTSGMPRIDVATIIHMINDLVCSAPSAEWRRVGEGSTPSEKSTSLTSTGQSAAKPLESETSSSACMTEIGNDSTGSVQWDNSDDQNNRTRGKLEQLRLVMGERRERRKQRKQKVQPYSLPIPETPPSDIVSP